MKKFLCLFMAGVLALSLAGCGKDNSEDTAEIVEKDRTDVSQEYGGVLVDSLWQQEGSKLVYEFSDDGTYTCGDSEGKWWMLSDGDVITIVLSGGEEQELSVAKLTNTRIEMLSDLGEDVVWTAQEKEEEAFNSVPEGLTRWESTYGYTMDYDRGLFTVLDEEEQETFIYNGGDGCYMTVKCYVDTSAISISGGIEIQSSYAVDSREMTIGSQGYDALVLGYGSETEYITDYIIESGERVYLFEVSVPGENGAFCEAISDMLATLTII